MSLLTKLTTGAAAALPVGAMADTYGKYETPPYVVEARIGEVELRSYQPHILAVVTVRGDRSRALGRGFQVLANYIFGGNSSAAQVAMTSPVAQSEQISMTAPVAQSGSDGQWQVTFMMPSDYTMDTLPRPQNPAVQLVEVTGDRQAVLTFSGRATTTALERNEATLRNLLAERGVPFQEPARYYFYDDPMTLPWQRRNEVAFVLPGSGS